MNDEAARQGRPDTYNVSAPNDTTGRGVNVATIPAELRSRPQWVVWRLEQRDGKPKPTKVPYRADGSGRASSKDSTTWSTFDMAVAASATADGIGYVFSADDPYVGVDLDDGLSEADRAAVMLVLDSYTETSFSGDGAHVIIRASLNGDGRHPHGFGVFDQRRFFVVTGMHVRGTPTTIEPRQDELDQVLARYLPATVTAGNSREPQPVDLADQEILDLAANAANGADFEQLWQGNLNGHPSQSEADLDLCGRLAFWTGADPNRIDRIFRAHGLMRPKWDTRRGDSTYGAQTIAKALEGCSDTTREFASRVGRGRDAITIRPGETGKLRSRPRVPT